MKKSMKYFLSVLLLTIFFLPILTNALIARPPIGSGEDGILDNLTDAVRETDLRDTDDLPIFIGRLIQFFLGFLAIIFVAMLIYAGFLYLTAGGEPSKVSKAKDMIRNAIIGVIIVLAAYAITVTVITKVQQAMTGGGG